MTSDTRSEDLFLGLVASLQAAAWMAMGKVVNPLTGKIDRDLARAQETIDLLGVLETKTRGNLADQEARLLQQILYELRMNYVEESRSEIKLAKPEEPGEPEASPSGDEKPA